MNPDCLFCRIVSGAEPAERVDATDGVIAINDKFPRAPVHVLIIPEQHLDSAHALRDEHGELLVTCFRLARRIAETQGIVDGYRVATNIGAGGGQAIAHLHFHVVGGKQLGYVDGAG
ncbi:MAG: HIT domain-containing protein [Euzebyales bacterium]|nr:HIT domain-containing protein [Euzebyales bacterium]